MLKKLIEKYNIRFKREHRVKVLLTLPFLLLLEKFWLLYKKIRGIHKPVIHLYAVCWNEAKILPFVLDYYKQFVDHFYIYDNYSDDETDTILRATPNLTVRKFDTGGQFNDLEHQRIKNSEWKKSRGKADWVIVIDMDEVLYLEQFIGKILTDKHKVTIYKLKGYDMVSDDFPKEGSKITEIVKTGVENFWFNKCILFDPNKIINMNYDVGSHNIEPEGIVLINNFNLKLLHYKNLGIEYVLNKVFNYRNRMSLVNIENNWGTHYRDEDELIIRKIREMQKNAYQVID